jgi:hypothetical protein
VVPSYPADRPSTQADTSTSFSPTTTIMAKRRILTPADGTMPAARKRAKAPDSEEDSAETEN